MGLTNTQVLENKAVTYRNISIYYHLRQGPSTSPERQLELLFIRGAKYSRLRNLFALLVYAKAAFTGKNAPYSGTQARFVSRDIPHQPARTLLTVAPVNPA